MIMEAIEELVERFINHTNSNIYLTGKAGTGKTTLLKKIVKSTHKKTLVVAPSGIAALNAGGVTIHSQFQIPFITFIPERRVYQTPGNIRVESQSTITRIIHFSNEKRRILMEAELLIIDEVSMLRADILDAVDYLMKYIRKNNKAFGGIQVMLCGDILQLPPIVNEEEWSVLSKYYRSIYFFSSFAFQKSNFIKFELENVYRQKDVEYTSLLNAIRNSNLSDDDLLLLNSRFKDNFSLVDYENSITLTTHNSYADNINQSKLIKIPQPEYIFNAEIKGDFPDHIHPVEKKLVLKVGAQIMFVKNDTGPEKLYYNGKIGIIIDIQKSNIKVFTEDGLTINIKPHEWSNIKYTIQPNGSEIEELILGSFKQFPIKLAWAITIHKSQGLTFEKAIIDIKNVFASGQIYVALSRLKSLDGLFLSAKIDIKSIQYANEILVFENDYKQQSNLNEIYVIESKKYLNEFVINAFNLIDHIKIWNDYLLDLGYKDDKQFLDYKIWFLETYKLLESEVDIGTKFIHQIQKVISTGNYLNLLERVELAENYFMPKIKNINNKIAEYILTIDRDLDLIDEIPDLLSLQNSNVNKLNKMTKSKLLLKHFLNSTLLLNEELKNNLDKGWQHDLPHNVSLKKKSKTSTTLSKTKKLFKAGLSPEQISVKRKLKLSTILNHIKIIKSEIQLN